MQNHSIAEIEDPITCLTLSVKSAYSETLCKYILSLLQLGKNKFIATITDTFGVRFAGRSENNVHFVAIFCVYVIDGEYHGTLTACPPLLKEGVLSTNSHEFFSLGSPSAFHKSVENDACVIDDNISLDNDISVLFRKRIIAWYAHKFNLEVKYWIE